MTRSTTGAAFLLDEATDAKRIPLRAHRRAEHLDLTEEDVTQIDRRREARRRAARHDAPAPRRREDALREDLAADVLDHDVDALLVGEPLALCNEVLRRVVDDLVGAELACARSAFSSVLVVVMTRAPSIFAIWIAALDTPLPAACTSTVWPGRDLGPCARPSATPSGSRAGSRRRPSNESRVRHRQEVRVRHDDVPRVAALRVLAEDPVAAAEVVLAEEASLARAAREARVDERPCRRPSRSVAPGPSASTSPAMSAPSRCGNS